MSGEWETATTWTGRVEGNAYAEPQAPDGWGWEPFASGFGRPQGSRGIVERYTVWRRRAVAEVVAEPTPTSTPAPKRKHPIQHVRMADDGVVRFTENRIVRWLLDSGPFDLNRIAAADFDREDREQFAQLIGYSVSGAVALEYVSDETLLESERRAKAVLGDE